MKPTLKLTLAGLALLAIAAAGTQSFETLPGLVIKHPVTGAVTAHINGTNGTVTAAAFVGDGSGLTGVSGSGNLTASGSGGLGYFFVWDTDTTGHWTNTIPSANFGTVTYTGATASTVPYFDGSKQLVSSAVSSTTLGYLDATSSIQTQLNGKLAATENAVTNTAGVNLKSAIAAKLDATENAVTNTAGVNLKTALSEKAPLASPTFTGTATAPTADLASVAIGGGTVTNNLAAMLAAGDTAFVNLDVASRTNDVSGAFTLAHATNGAAGLHKIQVRWFSNSSGSDQTLSIPAGWRTNLYSAVPTKITNGWITKMIVESWGDTSSSALQTNAFVSFEYFH